MLSVMMTESNRKPPALPSADAAPTKTRLGWPRRARLLEIMATIVCGSPFLRLSRWSTKAGRRLAVFKSELGNRTKTISPRRGLIINRSLRALPVLGEGFQPGAKISSLSFINTPRWQVHLGELAPRLLQDCLEFRLFRFDLGLNLTRALTLLLAQPLYGIDGFSFAHVGI